jgi:hypothetical protein
VCGVRDGLLTWSCLRASPDGKLSESSAINVELLNLDPRLGWLLMELPATLSFWFFYLVMGGPGAREPLPMLLAALWALHVSVLSVFSSLACLNGGQVVFLRG